MGTLGATPFVPGLFHVPRRQDLRHLHRLHPVRAGLPPRCARDGALGRLQGWPDRFLPRTEDCVGCKRCETACPTDFLSIRVYLGDETSRSMGLSY